MFISISSGEQPSFIQAANKLAQKAVTIDSQLNVIMPVRLVKVEIISFPTKDNESTIWLATGLMKKVDFTRQ